VVTSPAHPRSSRKIITLLVSNIQLLCLLNILYIITNTAAVSNRGNYVLEYKTAVVFVFYRSIEDHRYFVMPCQNEQNVSKMFKLKSLQT